MEALQTQGHRVSFPLAASTLLTHQRFSWPGLLLDIDLGGQASPDSQIVIKKAK